MERGIRRVVIAGVLLAITLLLVFARIGMIPVPTPAANATIAHIPAIIGGVLEGPLVGLIIGLGFGFASFMNAGIPMFKDPLVAILPRLFIGVTAAWTYMGLRRAGRRMLLALLVVLYGLMLVFSWEAYKIARWLGLVLVAASTIGAGALYWWMRREEVEIIKLAIAAAVGSLTNTVLVLSVAVWRGYLSAGPALMVGVTHGIPEVIVSAIVTVAVVGTLRHIGRRRARLSGKERKG